MLKCLLYSAVRIDTLLRLDVSDFRNDDHDPTLRLCEKGNHHRSIGLNRRAADAVAAYISVAGLTSGPLFRPRLNPRSQKLGPERMSYPTAYRLLRQYFSRLPGAITEVMGEDGAPKNAASTRRTQPVPRPPRCSWQTARTSAPSSSCLATATSRRRRFTTNAAG